MLPPTDKDRIALHTEERAEPPRPTDTVRGYVCAEPTSLLLGEHARRFDRHLSALERTGSWSDIRTYLFGTRTSH